jgi:hypothetical protein
VSTPRATAPVPHRVRQAFQLDALLELVVGLTLMGNPLLGPDVGAPSGVVAAIGVLLLVAVIFLGGAALGRGPLARRLRLLAVCNVVGGIVIVGLGALASMDATGRVYQLTVARRPGGVLPPRRRATPEELRAALHGQPRTPPSDR